MWSWLKTWWASREAAPSAPVHDPGHPLDALCTQYGATYLREVTSGYEEIQITLIRPDATLSATGATTAEAVENITKKVVKCWEPV